MWTGCWTIHINFGVVGMQEIDKASRVEDVATGMSVAHQRTNTELRESVGRKEWVNQRTNGKIWRGRRKQCVWCLEIKWGNVLRRRDLTHCQMSNVACPRADNGIQWTIQEEFLLMCWAKGLIRVCLRGLRGREKLGRWSDFCLYRRN